MEDSKYTKGEKTSKWPNIIYLVGFAIIAIGVPICLYYMWFGIISGYPVEERQLVFHVIPSPIRTDAL